MRRGMGMVGLIAALMVMLIPGCASRVDMPADDAGPDQVVRAHLEAIMAGDCSTARKLTDNGATAWCGWGSAKLGSYEIGVIDDQPPCSSPCEEPRQDWAESWLVHTTLNITRTDSGHSVAVGPEQPWIFLVARQAPSDPWRIIGWGRP